MKNKMVILPLLACLVLCLAGCGKRTEYTRQGVARLDAGDYAGAEDSFTRALNENGFLDGTKEAVILRYLADAQIGQQSYVAAQMTCERMLADAPENGDILILAGQCALDAGNTDTAMDYFSRAEAAGAPDGGYYAGLCLEARGDLAGAAQKYEARLREDSASVKDHIRLAVCSLEQKDGQKALQTVQEAMTLACTDEERRQLQYMEAVSYEYMGDYDTAREKMAAYVQGHPDDSQAAREYEFLLSR